MKRLWLYLEGRKLVALGLVLVATGNAPHRPAAGFSFATRSTRASAPGTNTT